MNLSYNWLKNYIDIGQLNAEKVAEILTHSGLEVEKTYQYQNISGSLDKLVVGAVKECSQHPNADKLKCTKVDVGAETIDVVCGAPNVAEGQKVIVALPGAEVNIGEGKTLKIKKSKLRGEPSNGMICAEDEIGLGSVHEGILVLEDKWDVGTPASEIFKIENDYIYEIGLTPNRSDAISHFGAARDLKAVLEKAIEFPERDERRPTVSKLSGLNITVEDTVACPRYSGLLIKNIEIGPSPQWMQSRLKSIGLTPINNVVDIGNFVMHELGQPLHAFDFDEIRDKKIIIKKYPGGAKLTTLDENEKELNADDLTISDAKGPMCIAGVFGGLNSGVSAKTTSVFIESAYFHPTVIRKTSTRLGLKTDASFRYERGTDPEMTVLALQRVSQLFNEIVGGEVIDGIFDHYPNPITKNPIKLQFQYLETLLGSAIPKDVLLKKLELLDFKIESESESGLTLVPPPYRTDVSNAADVAEEVIRIIGFNNLKPAEGKSPYQAPFPQKYGREVYNRIADMLSGKGFMEIITNSLTSPEVNALSDSRFKPVKMKSYSSEEQSELRLSLLSTGLMTARHNINHRQKDLKFYELGKIYHEIKPKEYRETYYLSILMTGLTESENWHHKGIPQSMFTANAAAQSVLQKLELIGVNAGKSKHPLLQPCIEYNLNDMCLGHAGRIDPRKCKKLGIEEEVYAVELNWDLLLELYNPKINSRTISKFPEVRRDLSIVIDKKVKFEDIRWIANKTLGPLLKEINVFDTYEGKPLEESQKSYSVSFLLQDHEKALNEKALEALLEKMIQAYEKDLEALIRR